MKRTIEARVDPKGDRLSFGIGMEPPVHSLVARFAVELLIERQNHNHPWLVSHVAGNHDHAKGQGASLFRVQYDSRNTLDDTPPDVTSKSFHGFMISTVSTLMSLTNTQAEVMTVDDDTAFQVHPIPQETPAPLPPITSPSSNKVIYN